MDPIHDEETTTHALISWGCLPREVVLRCWDDPAYADRLRQFPKETLAAAGVRINAGIDVQILSNSPDTLHLVVPTCPMTLRQSDPTKLTPDKW